MEEESLTEEGASMKRKFSMETESSPERKLTVDRTGSPIGS